MSRPNRREVLRAAAALGIAGLAPSRSLLAAAQETKVDPDIVRFTPDIEPLVRLFEETPRERCVGMLAERLARGTSYRQALAALFLAAIRNVSPQPPGFKAHAIFVIHSCHQLALDAPTSERLLPLFFALDDFKSSQERDVKEGDFVLRRPKGELPPADAAARELREAMETWDQERADRAIVALVRGRGQADVLEQLWEYGARDYRNIGHKAIFVANAAGALETIGWQHAEPTLRSVVLGLLYFGKDGRSNGYAFEDQCYRGNQARAKEAAGRLPAGWAAAGGVSGEGPRTELLCALREAKTDAACDLVVRMLLEGRATAGPLWDAIHLFAGESMMRQPGIHGIHTVTSANALGAAFRKAATPQTRLLVLLQAVGWMCQFRGYMTSDPGVLRSGKPRPVEITGLEPAELPSDEGEALAAIFEAATDDKPKAARLALAFGRRHPDRSQFTRAALPILFRKAREVHEVKYPAAVFEDAAHASPEFLPELLATAVYYLPGAGRPDSPVLVRAKEALSRG